MLSWICGNIRHDKMRNDNIKESIGITPIIEKMTKHKTLVVRACREKICKLYGEESRSYGDKSNS